MTNPTTVQPQASARSPELDLLRRVAVRVPCVACGGHYAVTLRQVLLAQRVVHEGCPARNEPECPPVSYASLADETALHQFDDSWWRLVDRVRSAGLELEC